MALFTLSYGVPTDRTLNIRLSDLEFAHNSMLRYLTDVVGVADIGEDCGRGTSAGRVATRAR